MKNDKEHDASEVPRDGKDADYYKAIQPSGKRVRPEAEGLLGQRMRKARIRRGMSQADLAEIVGIGQSTLANYESGFRRCPATVLIKISQALCMSVETMLGQRTPPGDEETARSYEDLSRILYSMPEDDIDAFLVALEIETARPFGKIGYDRDTSVVEWAGLGVEVAKKVSARGQDMIRQFIESVLSNPGLLKSGREG